MLLSSWPLESGDWNAPVIEVQRLDIKCILCRVLVMNNQKRVLVSLYFMGMACNTGGLQKQGGTDVDVDLHLAVRLLFTVLALGLTSVFVGLWEAEVGWIREPLVAEKARERSSGDQGLSPVAAEQR
ncbi:hypothetical protein AAES_49378 [Amazona aestiva]|uniref:Uncharacterized protein n=1 Tax=Amazona aestiva TaxID=12930 RepID=A0A0Q3RFZ3_AMAAE|nr:hypothetical protein AAES_49378 [Amazona aestiva]